MSAAIVTPTISIVTPRGEVTITVEVVTTRPQIERGLMWRNHLPYDAGMLFLMGRDAVWAFWMRNTFIALDIIYIARDLTIAGIIHNAQPCTDTRRGVHKPSSYVLEVNGGWAAAHQIAAGAKVRPGYCLKEIPRAVACQILLANRVDSPR